jgi:hypothetical protein
MMFVPYGQQPRALQFREVFYAVGQPVAERGYENF